MCVCVCFFFWGGGSRLKTTPIILISVCYYSELCSTKNVVLKRSIVIEERLNRLFGHYRNMMVFA